MDSVIDTLLSLVADFLDHQLRILGYAVILLDVTSFPQNTTENDVVLLLELSAEKMSLKVINFQNTCFSSGNSRKTFCICKF